MNKSDIVWVVYDEQCLFCRNYCKLVRIRNAVGQLVLVNARDDSSLMREITSLNMDIDQGMVVKFQGRIYYGSEAIHILSLLSTRSDLFNQITYRLFQSKPISSVLYPFLRECRNFILWLMDIPKINNLRKGGVA